MNAAQNQHYVPKFVLRQFLCNEKKAQVAVFDKNTNRTFTTSIDNIMAERRFNDFKFEESVFSFEGVSCNLEDIVLPTYRQTIQTEILPRSLDGRTRLAFLIAFQFARTKNSRQHIIDIEAIARKQVESLGRPMTDVEGWEPLTEDVLKRVSLRSLIEALPRYINALKDKTLLLMKAPSSRPFYIGDDPVVMHNDYDMGPYGNIGFGVLGIQIALPLSSSLILCAWCPSIIDNMEKQWAKKLPEIKNHLMPMVLSGRISKVDMEKIIIEAQKNASSLKFSALNGTPLALSSENIDWYNSLQMSTANRYLICKKGDFELARRFNAEHPGARRSLRFS